MFSKFTSLFSSSKEITTIQMSPDPPPKNGVLSLVPLKGKAAKQLVYSSTHVGGKGVNLLRLRAVGLNVPPFLIIPASEWDAALIWAQEHSGKSLDNWLNNEEATDNEGISEQIDQFQISEECAALIQAFVGGDRKRSFAVRSSATIEDGSDSAFAGQFSTILHVHGVENVILAVKNCWKSLIHNDVRPFYKRKLQGKPRMAVVIQEQIDSQIAGVYFQANPVTGATSTHVINARFGQGEGVVDGKASDEFWLTGQNGKIFKREIVMKEKKVALNDVSDGTSEIDLAPESRLLPSLSDDQINQLYKISKKIQAAFISPQDIEFGIGSNSEIYVFQSRPITTRLETMKFEAPNVGLWRLNSHISIPMSAIYDPIWQDGWSRGCMYNAQLTGTGMTSMETASLNGFGYFCMRFPGPKAPPTKPPPKFFMRMILSLTAAKDTKAAKAFWEKKNYLEFAQEFDTKLKPDWIQKHRELKSEGEKVETIEQARSHLDKAYEHFRNAWYAHVTYTLQQMLPACHFVLFCKKHANCGEAEAFAALQGFSPVTSGVGGEFPEQVKALSKSTEAITIFNTNIESNESASEALKNLKALEGETGEAAQLIIGDLECRLISGYDPADAICKEQPLFLFNAIKTAVLTPSSLTNGEDAAKELRSRLSSQQALSKEFDDLLQETRTLMKLRDERAIYTDLWAAGLLHDAVIRCADIMDRNKDVASFTSGDRLHHLALEATIEELRTALTSGVTPELAELWKERKAHRESASIRDAPPLLGGVDVALTPEHFPNQYLALSYEAIMLSVKEIATPPDYESQYQTIDKFLLDSNRILIGLPASKGVKEGIVCIVKSGADIANVKQGQILVTESPSSLINLVLPNVAGVVCDFGATLSHAAICARELGIPCVMGTRIGTITLKNGQKVRVDGTTGRVEVLSD